MIIREALSTETAMTLRCESEARRLLDDASDDDAVMASCEPKKSRSESLRAIITRQAFAARQQGRLARL